MNKCHGDKKRKKDFHLIVKERMSISDHSRVRNGSTTSNGKRNGTNYRYRTVNAQSEVDETLFGTPHRISTAAKLRTERQLNQGLISMK